MSILSILVFLVMLSALVAAHELGHFLFAKLCRMGVEEFAIGFGRPKLVWMRKNGTEYTLRPLPLGGFVRIAGMEPQEDGSEIHVENGFYSKSPVARLAVLFAGPLFSVLFGVILLVGIFTTFGDTKVSSEPVLAAIVSGGPADRAGISPGDRILSVDGKHVGSFYELIQDIRSAHGSPQTVVYQHEKLTRETVVAALLEDKPSEVLNADMTPTGELRKQYKWQSGPDTVTAQLPLGEAINRAVQAPIDTAGGILGLFSHPAQAKEQVGGIITIYKVTNAAVEAGFAQVAFVAAMLSISVGLFNLLPVSPLDGGQMLVALIEWFRKKRLGFEAQNRIATAGGVLVLALVVCVLYIDVSRAAHRPADQKVVKTRANHQ